MSERIRGNRIDPQRKKDLEASNIERELLSVIEKMTGSKEIMEMSENKGIENMCTALEELKMQGREEGRIYGAISVYRDFKLSEEEISKMLQEKFGLTPREVEEYLKKVWIF